jgi:DNA-nicking Smr family endonuclease
MSEDEDLPADEPVRIPIEDSLDLHAFRPGEVRALVEDYLGEARAAGFRRVRLIHGRGIGVRREMVRSLLGKIPGIAGFADAPPEEGGWGATIVWFDLSG